MTMPKAYAPERGYMYQILCRTFGEGWEHCDYAKDKDERDYLIGQYQLAYGGNWDIKAYKLPRKWWIGV